METAPKAIVAIDPVGNDTEDGVVLATREGQIIHTWSDEARLWKNEDIDKLSGPVAVVTGEEQPAEAGEQVTAEEVGLTDRQVRRAIQVHNTRQNKLQRRANRNRMAKASRKRNRAHA